MAVKPEPSIDYQLGQINAFTRVLTETDADTEALAETILALRLISRLWLQYAEDRPSLNLSKNILSIENVTQRPAFLAGILLLFDGTLKPIWRPLATAIKTIAKSAERLPAELQPAMATRRSEDLATLESIFGELAPDANIHPVEHLVSVAQKHADLEAFSEGEDADSRCWAFNMLFGARADMLGLTYHSLPVPSLFKRRCFRRDLEPPARAAAVRGQIVLAANQLLSDIYSADKLTRSYGETFASVRRDSRLPQAWTMLAGLKRITVRQLHNQIGGSEIGARRLLETLVAQGFAVHTTPWFECKKAFRLSASNPHWTQLPYDDISSISYR